MAQSPERRMYLYYQSLKRNRSYGYEHYRKGWLPGPYMMVAMRFKRPIKEVKDIIEAQKGPRV